MKSQNGKIERCKVVLGRASNANQQVAVLYQWIGMKYINATQFSELLNHLHLGISKSAFAQKKGKYMGNEDPEMTLG